VREVSELREGREVIVERGFLSDFGFQTVKPIDYAKCQLWDWRDLASSDSRLTVPSPPRVARYFPSGLKTIELVIVPFS